MSEIKEFRSYFFTLNATGVPEIDAILSLVAQAGKGYHNTEGWDDDDYGPSYITRINEASARAGEAWNHRPEGMGADVEKMRAILRGDHEIKPLSDDDLERILEFEEHFSAVGKPEGSTATLSWADQRKLIDEAVLAHRARAALSSAHTPEGGALASPAHAAPPPSSGLVEALRLADRIVAECQRLAPHYQSRSALDMGRIQILEHFAKWAHDRRAALSSAHTPAEETER